MELPMTNRLTVLLLVSSEGYFGVENMLVNLGAALSKSACRCVVGVFHDSRFPHIEVADRAREQGLAVEIVPCAGRFDPRAAAYIRKLIRTHHVDVIHTHGYKADLYAFAATAWSHVGLVATCHNWLGRSWNMHAYAALDRLSLRTFDRIVVVSEVVAEILRRSGIPSGRVEMISNGVEIERFRDAQPTLRDEIASPDEPLVGFVGRLVPEKGGEIFLRAGQNVLRSNRRAKFVIVGEGTARREWETLASSLGIRDRVVFTGARSDMPGVYASFHALVLPSLCEAMPMCLLEAMAAGKPVIATAVGAVPRIVEPDYTGLLLEPGDVKGLTAAITRLLDAPKLARWMGENGQARAIEHFSAESMAKQYLDVYRKVAGLRDLPQRDLSFLPNA
jgi:glycosyltransferase involved in cell wall biosynthesis